MIHFSQPGGAGDVEDGANIKTGMLCHLESEATEGWQWSLTCPKGSVSRLSAPLSPYPSFPADVPGTYRILFTVDGKKVYNFTVKAGT